MNEIRRRACALWVIFLLPSPVAVAQNDEWKTVPCAPADLPPEAMFDVVEQVDEFEGPDVQWKSLLGDQNARCTLHHDSSVRQSGAGSMRVEYDFVGKPDFEYLQLKRYKLPKTVDIKRIFQRFMIL